MIKWLEKWYASNCDNNWEHYHGIKIETLDNPGWKVEIDFSDTGIEVDDIQWELYEISDNNWIGYSIEKNVFTSSGDPFKLDLIINIFKEIIENQKLGDEYISSFLNDDLD